MGTFLYLLYLGIFPISITCIFPITSVLGLLPNVPVLPAGLFRLYNNSNNEACNIVRH